MSKKDFSLKGLVLSNVGNIKKKYKPKNRIVKPIGIHAWNYNLKDLDPESTFKMYAMFKTKAGINRINLTEFKRSLIYCDDHKRRSLEGIGFTIICEDTINIARWNLNQEFPYVLKNQLYAYTRDMYTDRYKTELLDIREEGCFCAWELGIVNHEKNAWLKYLNSQRTETDKKIYLEDFLEEGPLTL